MTANGPSTHRKPAEESLCRWLGDDVRLTLTAPTIFNCSARQWPRRKSRGLGKLQPPVHPLLSVATPISTAQLRNAKSSNPHRPETAFLIPRILSEEASGTPAPARGTAHGKAGIRNLSQKLSSMLRIGFLGIFFSHVFDCPLLYWLSARFDMMPSSPIFSTARKIATASPSNARCTGSCRRQAEPVATAPVALQQGQGGKIATVEMEDVERDEYQPARLLPDRGFQRREIGSAPLVG